MKFISNHANVEVKPFGAKGNGLVAKRPFRPGAEVATYLGKSYKDRFGPDILAQIEKHPTLLHYTMVEGDGILMPTWEQLKKPGAHLANHSCNPNCRFGKGASLYAKRSIRPAEEITVYYGWSGISNNACLCGDAHCTGLIGLKQTVQYGEPDPVSGIAKGEACELDREHLSKTLSAAMLNGWEQEFGQLLQGRIDNYPETLPVIANLFVRAALQFRKEGATFDVAAFELFRPDQFNRLVEAVTRKEAA